MAIRMMQPLESKLQVRIQRLEYSPAQKGALFSLLKRPITYVPDARFQRPLSLREILDQAVAVDPGRTLTAPQEQTLFLQMNYARCQASSIQRRLLAAKAWRRRDLAALLDWHEKQRQARSQIVAANMGLVLSMAKRSHYPTVEFTELISEGGAALLRATETFNASRGTKFSTYAFQAISKSFYRLARKNHRYRNAFPAHLEDVWEKDDHLDRRRAEIHQENLDEVRIIVQDNLAQLNGTESCIMKLRFPLHQQTPGHLTLKEVGEKLGMSKERVRQIQNQALAKIREVAQQRMFVG